MKFCDFINKKGISFVQASRESGVSIVTIMNLYYKRNGRLTLLNAYKLLVYAKGEVSFDEMCQDVIEADENNKKAKEEKQN